MQKTAQLADDNIKRLLFKLSLPASIGMLVMALYNVVDTIFVGRGVGAMGIGGLSIVFPIQMIVMAIGQLFGIGGASLASRSLGEQNIEKANQVLGTVYLSSIIIALALTVVSLLFKDFFLGIFGASEAIYGYASDYYEVIMLATVFFILGMGSNNLLRAEGNARIAMRVMIISSLLNIILDPIFIFWLDMGVRGAAWATVLSQIVSIIYVIYYYVSGKSVLQLQCRYLRVNIPILKEISAVGMSSFLRNVAGSLVFGLFNNILGRYGGDLAIAAYGIIQRFLRFLVMPVIGIAQGMQPIAGYNYGAKKYDKVIEVSKVATSWATVVAVVGFILIRFFAQEFISIFSTDTELIAIGASGLRKMTLLIPVVGFVMVVTTIFQSLGKAIPSLILSMSREILFLIPLVLILPGYLGLSGVWYSMPSSDVLSFILSLGFFIYLKKNMDKEMGSYNKNRENLQAAAE